jgi:hypothetical protein
MDRDGEMKLVDMANFWSERQRERGFREDDFNKQMINHLFFFVMFHLAQEGFFWGIVFRCRVWNPSTIRNCRRGFAEYLYDQSE